MSNEWMDQEAIYIVNLNHCLLYTSIPMAEYLRAAGGRGSIYDNEGLLSDIRLKMCIRDRLRTPASRPVRGGGSRSPIAGRAPRGPEFGRPHRRNLRCV